MLKHIKKIFRCVTYYRFSVFLPIDTRRMFRWEWVIPPPEPFKEGGGYPFPLSGKILNERLNDTLFLGRGSVS